MTTYPTTQAFAYNKPSETVFYCVSCAKEMHEKPHEHFMMVDYHNEMSFIRCDECGTVVKDE